MKDCASKAGLNVVGFKHDLRVGDHQALTLAATGVSVLPLYIAESHLRCQSDMSADIGALSARLFLECERFCGTLTESASTFFGCLDLIVLNHINYERLDAELVR